MEKTSKAQTNLSEYDNSWFDPGSFIKQLLWYLTGRIFINTYLPVPVSVKVFVLRLFGAKIGQRVMIKPKVNIKYPWFLTVGDNTWIGEKVWIDNLTTVTLGANVCLSQECYLLTGNHDYTKSKFDLIVSPVTIENGGWIGAKAVVCPGVTVGTHAVLAVNSVATRNLEPYMIYQGNPATIVKIRNITH
jgi:putative colanic acid biosynthesis acetyltransferase WcaF